MCFYQGKVCFFYLVYSNLFFCVYVLYSHHLRLWYFFSWFMSLLSCLVCDVLRFSWFVTCASFAFVGVYGRKARVASRIGWDTRKKVFVSDLFFFFSSAIILFFLCSTTLDWVHGLQPEDLEKFLAEKKEQRMRVLCLDLEPTGIPQQVRRHLSFCDFNFRSLCFCLFFCSSFLVHGF